MAHDMAALSVEKKTPHLADELLLGIFSTLQLPPAIEIGKQRYETLHVPQLEASIYSGDGSDYIGANATQDVGLGLRLRTLSAISKCSKRFRKLVTPLLYRVYPGQEVAPPRLLVRSLLARSELVSYVKEMALDYWDAMDFSAVRSQTRDSNWQGWWQSSVKKLGLSKALLARIGRLADKDLPDAIAALLLVYCTDIETLDLSAPMVLHASILTPLFKELLHPRPNTWFRGEEEDASNSERVPSLPLRHLRNLSVRLADSNYVAGILQFGTLLRLPTIQAFTPYRFTSEADFLVHMRNLQSLCLWRCSFDQSTLVAALKACRPLRRLTIVWAGYKISFGEPHPIPTLISLSELGDIIRAKHHRLEQLWLDPRECWDSGHQIKTSVGPLIDCAELRELTLPDFALMGGPYDNAGKKLHTHNPTRLVDILPTSLRRLAVLCHRMNTIGGTDGTGGTGDAWTEEVDEEQLAGLLANPRFSALRSIHLDRMTPLHRIAVEEHGWVADTVFADKEVMRASLVLGTMGDREAKKRSLEMQKQRDEVGTVRLRKK
ncbi:hypothetical protein LTR36_007368 [Oleoguttula mirabilis]|uniref:Leucine-rich repeat domain-containing protein n=1 Tax=Oleoguttula mirabilis TaxID=1507867 RepID=A0AAV9JA18_9PEZI|nr:hypothetical protein LTR36_007368 [Oleoguttula mirabilis]